METVRELFSSDFARDQTAFVRKLNAKPMLLGLLIRVKEIAKATGSDPIKAVDSFLSSPWNNELTEDQRDSILGLISHQLGWNEQRGKTIADKWLVSISHRSSESAVPHGCYNNAYNEYQRTGNLPLIGYIVSGMGNLWVCTPHAFNYDKKTQELYDTNRPGMALPENSLVLCYLTPEESLTYLEASILLGVLPFNILKDVGEFCFTMEAEGSTTIVQFSLDNTVPKVEQFAVMNKMTIMG